eukprot:CAMPEP_0174717960 /NCGR_PEP_ID=MMETSP1094-20130205/27658_1 /TAXON_ID=156173 /ORGANISM="Chrysochromulina brevifilum, Strain UTEX LB 985" /LENGTH=72 /DNA_ID=CAMNT_0015917969 /DNA_START=595 /DNA_END=809 /DNA_ORIENTATION=-
MSTKNASGFHWMPFLLFGSSTSSSSLLFVRRFGAGSDRCKTAAPPPLLGSSGFSQSGIAPLSRFPLLALPRP